MVDRNTLQPDPDSPLEALPPQELAAIGLLGTAIREANIRYRAAFDAHRMAVSDYKAAALRHEWLVREASRLHREGAR